MVSRTWSRGSHRRLLLSRGGACAAICFCLVRPGASMLAGCTPLRFRPERFLRHGITDRGAKAILHAPPFSTDILQKDFHVCRYRCFCSVSTRPCAVSCISFAVHVRVGERESVDTTGAEVSSDDQSQQGL